MKANSAEIRKAILNSINEPTEYFCNKILRSPNDPWQAELMDAIADLDRARMGLPTRFNHDLKNRFSVSACQGPGKTHVAAKIMHWFNFTRKGRIPVTAPKEKQVTTRVWPEFRKLSAGAIPGYSTLISVSQTAITWKRDLDHCALVEAASQPENLQGLHDEFLMFIVEEASGVHEMMFPVIEGSLSTPKSIMLMIGNPTRNEGEFYNSRNDPEIKTLYYSMRVSHKDSPRIDPTWVDKMRRKYGEGSPIFKIRCLGEDASQDANQLMPLAWLDNALALEYGEWEDGSFPRLRVCVDVADGGEDETVITVQEVRDSNRCLRRLSRHNWEPSLAIIEAGRVAERVAIAWAEEAGIPIRDVEFVVDALGVGAGTAGWLMDQGYTVLQYRGGSTEGVNTTRYRNRRTQSYLSWRDDLRDGRFIIAPDAIDPEDWNEFCKQAMTIRSKPGTERLEDLETKEEMQRRRGVKSPDMPDSVAMGYSDQVPTLSSGGGEIKLAQAGSTVGGLTQWDS